MVEKIKTYYNETVAELHKVTWPSKPEVIGSTIVTVVVSLIAGFFMFGVDMLLAQGVSMLLGI
jgi:preprotein translocase subunit SecE